MNELKKEIIDKLGIDENLAEEAIQLVLNYAKLKLPENLRGPIEQIAKGETPSIGNSALNALKNMLD